MQFSALPVSPTVSASSSSAVQCLTSSLSEHIGDYWGSENLDRMIGEE